MASSNAQPASASVPADGSIVHWPQRHSQLPPGPIRGSFLDLPGGKQNNHCSLTPFVPELRNKVHDYLTERPTEDDIPTVIRHLPGGSNPVTWERLGSLGLSRANYGIREEFEQMRNDALASRYNISIRWCALHGYLERFWETPECLDWDITPCHWDVPQHLRLFLNGPCDSVAGPGYCTVPLDVLPIFKFAIARQDLLCSVQRLTSEPTNSRLQPNGTANIDTECRGLSNFLAIRNFGFLDDCSDGTISRIMVLRKVRPFVAPTVLRIVFNRRMAFKSNNEYMEDWELNDIEGMGTDFVIEFGVEITEVPQPHLEGVMNVLPPLHRLRGSIV